MKTENRHAFDRLPEDHTLPSGVEFDGPHKLRFEDGLVLDIYDVYAAVWDTTEQDQWHTKSDTALSAIATRRSGCLVQSAGLTPLRRCRVGTTGRRTSVQTAAKRWRGEYSPRTHLPGDGRDRPMTDTPEDATGLPEYDDRVLLETGDLEALSGGVFPVVESEDGQRIAIDIRMDSGEPQEWLDIAEALLDASNDFRDDYYALMNDVDPGGDRR